MTYRPGSSTVPGTSTAPVKVTVVRLSHSVALIDGDSTDIAAAQVIATVNKRILFMIHWLLTISFGGCHCQAHDASKASGLPSGKTTRQINQLGSPRGRRGKMRRVLLTRS